MSEPLREHLRDLAESVGQVDLRDRVLAGSRRVTRRNRLLVAVSTVVLLGGGVGAGFALVPSHTPEPGQTSPTVTTSPGPDATVHPSPDPLPAPNLSPTPAGPWSGAADPPPDASLDGMDLRIPDWPGADPGRTCGGQVRLTGGLYPFTTGELRQLRLVKAVPDGTDGVAALFYCQLGEQGHQFQVADYRWSASGRLELRGQVLASGADGVMAMFDITAAHDVVVAPEIRIEVGDRADPSGIGRSSHDSVHDWRAYAWTGAAFSQVAGPTSFPPNPNFYDLSVTATDLTFGPYANGGRHGTVKITIRNAGPGPTTRTTVQVWLPDSVVFRPEASTMCPGGGWRTEPPAPLSARACDLGVLAPGSTAVLYLAFAVDTSREWAFPDQGMVDVEHVAASDPIDTNDLNDRDTFAIAVT